MEKNNSQLRIDHREKQNKRVEQRNKRRERERRKRRFPYTKNTHLSDLVKVEAYDRMNEMFRALRPYLLDPIAARRTPYIAFDSEAMKGHKEEIYRIIARFISSNDISPLRVSIYVFARYLTDRNHSNFSLLAITLYDKLLKAKNARF